MKSPTERTRRRYDRMAPIFDLMQHVEGRRGMGQWREELWSRVEGEHVLEVGVGTGANLSLYPPGRRVTAIDLSPRMLARARAAADQMGVDVDLRLMDAERLDFPDGSFDAVVTSCVFCSVPDPVAGFRELRRVLRPNGHGYFLEHVLSCRPVLSQVMRLVSPVVVRLTGRTSTAALAATWNRRGSSSRRRTTSGSTSSSCSSRIPPDLDVVLGLGGDLGRQ